MGNWATAAGHVRRLPVAVAGAAVGLLATGWSACARQAEPPASRAPVADLLAIDRARAVAIRSEPTRAVVELVELARGVRWRAAIPPYAGAPERPGLAASPSVVHVRVLSDGRADLVALDLTSGRHIATIRLSPGAGGPAGALSVAGEGRSYQLVGGAVLAVSFERPEVLWRHQVDGQIDLATAVGPDLALVVAGSRLLLDGATGELTDSSAAGAVAVAPTGGGIYSLTADLAPLLVPGTPPRAPPVELTFDPAARRLLALEPATGRRLGALSWPPGALRPEPHHHRDGALWIALPRGLAAVDARTVRMTAAAQ